MRKKEKRPYSVLSNFIFTLKTIFKVHACSPIFYMLAMLASLVLTVWTTYENKLLLDALESENSVNRILLAIIGIVGIYCALLIIQLIFWMIQNYHGNRAWEKLYRRSFDTVCG